MATTETERRSVYEKCSYLVDQHFADHPFEGFSLKTFTAPKGKEGLLDELRNEAPIPRDPSCSMEMNVPSLLLHDLHNEWHKSTEVYKFIDETKDICSGLYGTSGAGKTRSVYEYLSHNYGFYFVAETENDAGSMDFKRLLHFFSIFHSADRLSSLDVHDSQPQDEEQRLDRRKTTSSRNYDSMARYIRIMIYVRTLVFDAINKQLNENKKPELTPYDWLLIQLFPKQAMKRDLFSSVCIKCLDVVLANPADNSADRALLELNADDGWCWSVMAVDEAQVLLKSLDDFFLSSDQTKKRTALSAVLNAMSGTLVLLGSQTGFPLVAGTGMSIDEMREVSVSIMAKKPATLRDRSTIFKSFKPLNEMAVKNYLLTFLNLDLDEAVRENKVSNSCVIEHVSKWLCGRPRWAASFLELYLVRQGNSDHAGTRRSFSAKGEVLIQALDRYLENYTNDTIEDLPADSDRRKSFDPPKGTAFSAIKCLVDGGRGSYQLSKKLESAIFNFAVGGNPTYIDYDFAALVEVGVAALSLTDQCAVIDEPIVIQAGINYFSLQTTAINNLLAQERGGRGDAFEKVMLPAIQRKFPEILREQLGNAGDALKNYTVPHRSAYGMLALQCDCPSKTIEWIKAATECTFEGQVAPFCYPDTRIGPDLMFLLWNDSYTEYVTVISQAKYRKELNQMEALRTITPTLLYHDNRDKGDEVNLSTVISNDASLKRRWDDVQPKLVGREHGCVRFMVQYPCGQTRSANPGVLEDHQVKVATNESEANKSDGNSNKKRRTGWLTTISSSNASTLFDGNGLEVLNALKLDSH